MTDGFALREPSLLLRLWDTGTRRISPFCPEQPGGVFVGSEVRWARTVRTPRLCLALPQLAVRNVASGPRAAGSGAQCVRSRPAWRGGLISLWATRRRSGSACSRHTPLESRIWAPEVSVAPSACAAMWTVGPELPGGPNVVARGGWGRRGGRLPRSSYLPSCRYFLKFWEFTYLLVRDCFVSLF